jgi:hypothetical protein
LCGSEGPALEAVEVPVEGGVMLLVYEPGGGGPVEVAFVPAEFDGPPTGGESGPCTDGLIPGQHGLDERDIFDIATGGRPAAGGARARRWPRVPRQRREGP